jgi:hypothetical protein
MTGLKARVEDSVTDEGFEEIQKITSESVKAAALMMKKVKTDVSGSYNTDALRLAPDALFEKLALIYRSFLVHGTVSRPLLACAFMPLLKSALKDPGDTKSYRAIAGSSTMLMLFDRLVLNLWGDRLAEAPSRWATSVAPVPPSAPMWCKRPSPTSSMGAPTQS